MLKPKLGLPYPKSSHVKKRLKFNMEVLRTVGAIATLMTCILNLWMFNASRKVLEHQYNQILMEQQQQ